VSAGQLGVIGIGLVGSALCERFLAAGFRVIGFDLDQARTSHLQSIGGKAARSALDVASSTRRTLLSLPNSGIVATVLAEIEPALQPGDIIIDTTTGMPEQVAGFGACLAKRGVRYIDATIGGSSRQVGAGEAIVMCGGDVAAYSECQDVISLCGRKVFHLGPCGAGASMKLVLNLVLGLNRAVLAEGLSYAAACGIEPKTALEVLQAGPAYSRVMDIKGHKMLDGEFTAEARLSQHLKDVRLILASGEKAGARLPLSHIHSELLTELENAGFGAEDNSAIIRAFRRQEKQ
jgi:3-hydroxyisobutyrate dehydrogenase-like beta-hydroxyacid dehydrogenase